MAKNFNKQYPQRQLQQNQKPEEPIEQVGQSDQSDPVDPVDLGTQDASSVQQDTPSETSDVSQDQGQNQAAEDQAPSADQAEASAPAVTEQPVGRGETASVIPVDELAVLKVEDTAAPAVVEAPVVEVKAVPEAPAAPVAQAPAPTPEAEPVLSEEEAYLKKIKDSGTDAQKRILAAVETFQQQLDPKRPASPEAISSAQHEFLQHLLWILKKDYEVFRGAWNALLVHFSVHHGVSTPSNYSALTEYSTDRYLYAWTKGEHTATTYRNLITVLRATRNKERRQHDIKTIVLEKVGPEVLSEDMLSNLKKFYGV